MKTIDKDEESTNGVKWKPRYRMNHYVWWLLLMSNKKETTQSMTNDGLSYSEHKFTYE